MINILFTILLAATPSDQIQTMFLAESYLKSGQTELAIENFNRALASGELNDYAKISSYWNLHIAYDSLKRYDEAGESLMAFLLSAESLKEYLSELNRPEHPGHTFFKQLDMQNKMSYAIVMLEVYWMKHNPFNCKTKENACTLPEKKFYMLYQIRTPFCGDARKVKDAKRIPSDIIHVKIQCNDEREEEYYFR